MKMSADIDYSTIDFWAEMPQSCVHSVDKVASLWCTMGTKDQPTLDYSVDQNK
jgi:hypothetical protein